MKKKLKPQNIKGSKARSKHVWHKAHTLQSRSKTLYLASKCHRHRHLSPLHTPEIPVTGHIRGSATLQKSIQLTRLPNKHFFTAMTLEKGTFSSVIICCLVVRQGTLIENACRRDAEEILPLNTLRVNIKSCFDRRADTDVSLKCFSGSIYDNNNACCFSLRFRLWLGHPAGDIAK